ncbi:50S ribosomal protein L30 [Haloarchaeobius iranensis]|uniref:Large ribosomal subunit protein uL30 n=1 Tax=Haloarchaeobius iranensis TaxID=996166 RepID=A0A1H0AEZ3_9EURY|nr:50S ribosomal protein L30 [Haloarchaeobius iranensis]SDN31356.1 LSU ribosomal protein L30P [Haloarchaeobius iranensis]
MQAVIQVRGEVDMSGDIQDTLEMLNLHRVNHATLVPETESYRGMLTKVNDYVAMGEPSQESLATVLATRGEVEATGEALTDEWVAEETEYGSIDELAEALLAEETTLKAEGVSPVLRLHPPRKGHDGIKHPTKEGGELGKHTTEEVDKLLEAMR